MEQTIKTCQTCNKQFRFIEMELSFYKKQGYPLPTECPRCRHVRREKTRGWRDFYKRSCAKCGKEIVTVYPPESGFVVYCQPCFSQYYSFVDPLKQEPTRAPTIDERASEKTGE